MTRLFFAYRRVVVVTLLALLSVSPVFAKTKAVVNDSTLSKLVSRETVALTPAQAEKAAAEKKEKEKKYALLDPSDEDEKAKGKIENLTGEVGSHNNFGVAIALPFDVEAGAEREAWFNFTSKTKLNGYVKFKDIQDGDNVTVIYKETETGKRILKGLTFLGHKPKEMPAPEEPASSESASPALEAAAS